MNKGKSTLLAVGELGDLRSHGLRVQQEVVKVLGVPMDVKGKGEVAWEDLLGWVRQTLGIWGHRGFLSEGKSAN